MEKFFENETISKKPVFMNFFLPLSFLAFYIFSQYFLKLQFLVPVKTIFAGLVLMQILSILFFYTGRFKWWVGAVIFSSLIWSLSVIHMHKNIYTAIKSVAVYSRDNLEGKIVSNDTTSIIDWYLNYSPTTVRNSVEKWDFLNKSDLSYNRLLEDGISYVVTTNEDGTGFDYGIEELTHVKLIKSFRYNIGETKFFANIFRFER
jgi:hypothetical protein